MKSILVMLEVHLETLNLIFDNFLHFLKTEIDLINIIQRLRAPKMANKCIQFYHFYVVVDSLKLISRKI